MNYLTQEQAIHLDEDLMGKYQYSLSQLMEVAGLSVAQVVAKEFPLDSNKKKVLILCGPGNNGGDGLVAGRYLNIFGYEVSIYYPKPSKNEYLQLLVKQLEVQKIKVYSEEVPKDMDIVVDAIFGFSFKGPIRGVFKDVINNLNETQIPIVSVDVPSGWDVEKGYIDDGIKNCSVLVSLSAPKLGVKDFKGKHYLGGRFIPNEMKEELHLNLPYKDNELITLLN